MIKTFQLEHLKKFLFILLQLLIVVLSIAVGYFGHRYIGQYREEFGLLRQAHDILVDNTILEIPEGPALEYGMIRGMLNTLGDPNTHFVEPAAHEVQTDQLTGTFGGIGVHLERDLELNWRIYPLPESPALEAGLLDGDLLLQVEDLPITAETDEVTLTATIRGPVGESVRIAIHRDGEDLSFSIRRESFPLPSVSWRLLLEAPQIGLVQINRIASTTAGEIRDGIQDLQQQGAKGIALDLRDNGGGLVEAGIDITQLFLSEGEILHRQFRGQEPVIFHAEETAPFDSLPMVMLINSNTASSAEIIAGALQVHQRAALIGTHSAGKTTIQYIFELQDGSSIHITSGRWWIPGQTFPLLPDHPIQDDPTGEVWIQTAIDVLTAIIH